MNKMSAGFGGIVGAQAICRSGAWQDTAARICADLPARVVGLFSHPDKPTGRGGEILGAVGIEPAFIERYRTVAAQNPWLTALCRSPRGAVVTGAELVSPFELVRTEFYRDWLRPLNLRHALIGIVQHAVPPPLFVIALRAPSQVPFGSADARLLELLLPCLVSAVACAAELAITRDLLDDMIRVLGMCAQAVMLVDDSGRPVMLNPPARLMLSQADGLVLRQDLLAAASRQETLRLRGVIADAAREASGGDATAASLPATSVAITRPSGGAPLILHVASLPRPVPDEAGRMRQVAAVLACQPAGAEILGVFREHFGMTPTEARLASLIADGRSLLDAAAEMGISRNTARTHMKRVYAKTATRRQAELVRLLGSGGVGAS